MHAFQLISMQVHSEGSHTCTCMEVCSGKVATTIHAKLRRLHGRHRSLAHPCLRPCIQEFMDDTDSV